VDDVGVAHFLRRRHASFGWRKHGVERGRMCVVVCCFGGGWRRVVGSSFFFIRVFLIFVQKNTSAVVKRGGKKKLMQVGRGGGNDGQSLSLNWTVTGGGRVELFLNQNISGRFGRNYRS
jgi:hypothetical protein